MQYEDLRVYGHEGSEASFACGNLKDTPPSRTQFWQYNLSAPFVNLTLLLVTGNLVMLS